MESEKLITLIKNEFSYDETTGVISAKVSRGKRKAGSVVGSKTGGGYIVISLCGKKIYAHRVAYAIAFGFIPDLIDHINGDKSDNRTCNLRAASTSQNNANSKQNKCGYRGVSFHKKSGRWRADIRSEGKLEFLGYFKTPEAAAYAYDSASINKHGVFGRRNFLPLV